MTEEEWEKWRIAKVVPNSPINCLRFYRYSRVQVPE